MLNCYSGSSGHSTGLAGAPKTSWPELVGLTAGEAEKKVKEDFPKAEIQVVPPNHFVTMDYRTSRVRIHVDSSGKVERPPRTD
ncbi:unnamed protein product [Ilex paraguariensis]|uniref:Subtilisin inhibitor 1 n=1 Tax=Ilex paraguariensis TaxID=185542 RepID=A0ABC8SQB2_9AQUA